MSKKKKSKKIAASKMAETNTPSWILFDNDAQRQARCLAMFEAAGIEVHILKSLEDEKALFEAKQRGDSLLVHRGVDRDQLQRTLQASSWQPEVCWYLDPGDLFSSKIAGMFSVSEAANALLDYTVAIIDSHGGKLRSHAYTVRKYALIACEQLALSQPETEVIGVAAYVHDFHKLSQQSQNLSVNPQKFFARLGVSGKVLEIIKHMDERYDGSGIPDGLAGDAIPLGSRILAVANMLDEISRGKVDTQVIKRDEAFNSLKKRAGSYLDETVIEALVQGLTSIGQKVFREVDARLLIAFQNDNARYRTANLFMENGYTVRTTTGYQDTFNALYEFWPHLILLDGLVFNELVEYCNQIDVVIRKPVIIFGEDKAANENLVNDVIPVEAIVPKSIKKERLLERVGNVIEKFIEGEKGARESAENFERAGNYSKAGNAYRDLGDYRRAAQMYEEANAFSLAAEMYEYLQDIGKAARAYEMAGDYINAATLFGKAEMYEDRGRVYEKTGDYYYSAKNKLFQGNIDEALRLFQRLQPDHEKYRKACYFIAKIHMGRKEWRDAINFYEKVIGGEKIHRRNLRHFYNVAVANEHLRNNKVALELYEKILGVDYNFRDVLKRTEGLREKVQKLEQRTKMEQKVTDFAASGSLAEPHQTRYEKNRVCGRGGMGVVYDATDLVLGRRVALKVLSAAFREDKFVVETFLREAKAAAMLNHVNIVTIFDAGIENSNYFIAMEMIEGKTLKEIIQNRRFSIASTLRIMRQIANGLQYAHSKKIIHRDLTNSNIMLTKDNIIKIMDFGLARIVEQLMSEQSIIGGTPSYMAPEQVQGAPIDHRADIYALGVDLFELTTGSLPFMKGDLGYHHVHTQAPNPRDINPKIPEELAKVILRCLEKDPQDRFQSVQEFMQALKI